LECLEFGVTKVNIKKNSRHSRHFRHSKLNKQIRFAEINLLFYLCVRFLKMIISDFK